MIYCNCVNYIGDEDCNKCTVLGYFYGGCEGCPDYETFRGKVPLEGGKKEEEVE